MKLNNKETCTANLEVPEKILFILINALSCILTTSGNVMVLAAVYKTRSLRTISNCFLCSLAVADFLVGILVNPLYIAIVILNAWVMDHPLYKAENYLWMQTLTVTTFSLGAVSIDRYFAITNVFRYQEIMTRRKCIAIISSIWIFSVVFALTGLLIDTEDSSKAWVACMSLTVGLPLTTMVYCYYHIFYEAKNQSRKITMTQVGRDSIDVQKMIKNRKAAVTVAFIIGLFVILFSPSFAFSIIEFSTTGYCKKTKSVSKLDMDNMVGFYFILTQPMGVCNSFQEI